MSTYAEWIASYLDRHHGKVLGRCNDATKEMLSAFPELRIVKGHVYTVWGKRGHVWLVDPNGEIVDPTESQFPGIFEYEPWVPGGEVRVGKCMNCGDEIWKSVESLDVDPGHSSACSKECEESLIADLGGE